VLEDRTVVVGGLEPKIHVRQLEFHLLGLGLFLDAGF
jgi:hypothetical protein